MNSSRRQIRWRYRLSTWICCACRDCIPGQFGVVYRYDDLKLEVPAIEEVAVDAKTLAAIDLGMADADAGRVVPSRKFESSFPSGFPNSNHRSRVSGLRGNTRLFLGQFSHPRRAFWRRHTQSY